MRKQTGMGPSMTPAKSISVLTAFGLGLVFVSFAWGDAANHDACAALVDTRVALYSMLSAKDKPAQDALNAKVQAASTKLDSALTRMTGTRAQTAADFRAVWEQFKTTRDKDIIPAVSKGNIDYAKKLVNGIQLSRLSKMFSIMSCK